MITISLIGNKVNVFDHEVKANYLIGPPYFSLRKRKNIRGRSVVIGFVGPRGSGKSVGGARLVIWDFFLKGITNVWSNMDIGCNLKMGSRHVELRSHPIDKITLTDLDRVYQNGVIFEDEVNMSVADSRRATARGTLGFDYVVQQLRKRRLNLIWTAQSEDQVEMRLRNATDIFVKCSDISLRNPKCGIGELTHYKCYDYAGLINEELPSKTFSGVFEESTVWNKPWWNSYSTWQLQGVEDEKAQEPSEEEVELTNLIDEIAEFIRTSGEPVKKKSIWAKWSITDINTKMRIGQGLSQRGIVALDDHIHYVTQENYS